MGFANPQLGQSDWTQSPVSGDTIVNFTAKAWTGETPDSVFRMTLENIWSDVKSGFNTQIKKLFSGTIEVVPPSELDYIPMDKPAVIRTEARLHDDEPGRWSLSLKPYSLSKEVAILPTGTPVIIKGRNRKGGWYFIEAPDGLSGYVVSQRVKAVMPKGGESAKMGLGTLAAGAVAAYFLLK